MLRGLSSLCIALALGPIPSAWAQGQSPEVVLTQPARAAGANVSVRLQAADAATAARTLGEALGGIVRIEGGAPAPLTLDLEGVPAGAVLDAAARALHGNWRPIYTMTSGSASSGARRPAPLGRTVTANLDGVSARTAVSVIARGAGGAVEMVGELPQKVSLKAKDTPVEQALDEVAKQAGATWSVTYVIKAGVPGPTPTPAPSQRASTGPTRQPQLNSAPTPGRGSGPGFATQGISKDVLNDRRAFPMPFADQPPPPAKPDPNAAKMLGEGLARIMQMPPAQRRAAVKDFATQIDQQFRQLQALPAPRRNEQMAAMRPLYQAASRTYSGLTPELRREFQPIIEVFNRWMR
jgi:hypothetical protein